MKIKLYRALTKEVVKDINQLSILMQDANETSWAVFGACFGLLHGKRGCFFVAYKGSLKVAYGMFSYGISDSRFRRLYYFAVEPDFRGRGIGMKSINDAIRKEVDLKSGCIVTCMPSLQSYYENIGFKFRCMAGEKNDDQIALVLSERSLDTISLDDVKTGMIEVGEVFKQVTIPQIEREYGLKLLEY